jgi:hypothetical protein
MVTPPPCPASKYLRWIKFTMVVAGEPYNPAGSPAVRRPSGGWLSNFKNELTGCGPFLHDDPRDRPPEIFGGTTSLHFGGTARPYLLLPIIPPKKKKK